jgi:glutamate/tyrosine decarboxylase-like PLP-dependent enzyme
MACFCGFCPGWDDVLTLWQEDEAEKLMTEAFSKNFIDYEEYPRSAEIQNRCVSMIARLFNARKFILYQRPTSNPPTE